MKIKQAGMLFLKICGAVFFVWITLVSILLFIAIYQQFAEDLSIKIGIIILAALTTIGGLFIAIKTFIGRKKKVVSKVTFKDNPIDEGLPILTKARLMHGISHINARRSIAQ